MNRGYTTTDEVRKLKYDQKRMVIEKNRLKRLIKSFQVIDDKTNKELNSILERYEKLITSNGKNIKRIRQKNSDKFSLLFQDNTFNNEVLPLYKKENQLLKHAEDFFKKSDCSMSQFVKIVKDDKVTFYYGFLSFTFENPVCDEKYTKAKFKNKFLNKIRDNKLATYLSQINFGYNKGDAVLLTDNFKLTIVL